MADAATHLDRPDALKRARRFIEANLDAPLDAGRLAEAAGLSAYHFSRQFTARFDVSPMAYVRQRRLVQAAERLAGPPPHPNLIELAFDCGFESQEAFTRAFKRAFGVPPGEFRRDMTRHLENVLMPVANAPALTRSPGPVAKPALRIVGLAGEFNEATKAQIPQLWMRLVPHLPARGQVSHETFGVCMSCPEAGETGMRYLAGVGVPADAPETAGLEEITLPARSYLVFRLEIGPEGLHPQMQAAL